LALPYAGIATDGPAAATGPRHRPSRKLKLALSITHTYL
jgi:hypothetical protein